jgi:hypothetical protein
MGYFVGCHIINININYKIQCFKDIVVKKNLLVEERLCNDEGVTFYKVIK